MGDFISKNPLVFVVILLSIPFLLKHVVFFALGFAMYIIVKLVVVAAFLVGALFLQKLFFKS